MKYNMNNKQQAENYLEKMYNYLEGYRKDTAKIAIQVLNKSDESLSPFSTKESAYEFAKLVIQADEERLTDVAKMLYVLHNEITRANNHDYETSKRLLERKQRRKDVHLRKVVYRDFK